MAHDATRRSLLLVDDDQFMLMLCERVLLRSVPGLKIDQAASGEAAIERLKSARFDVVLTDFRMGPVTGTDVLEFALGSQPAAVRLLMSGYGDPAMVTQARARARIHGFLEKPMTIPEIEHLLRTQVVEPFLLPSPPHGA